MSMRKLTTMVKMKKISLHITYSIKMIDLKKIKQTTAEVKKTT